MLQKLNTNLIASLDFIDLLGFVERITVFQAIVFYFMARILITLAICRILISRLTTRKFFFQMVFVGSTIMSANKFIFVHVVILFLYCTH